jgi:DNA repair exonuclease SbcCD ATPase subunit
MSQLIAVKPSYDQLVNQLSVLSVRELQPLTENAEALQKINQLKAEKIAVDGCLLARKQLPAIPTIPLGTVKSEYDGLESHRHEVNDRKIFLFKELGNLKSQSDNKAKLGVQIAEMKAKTGKLPELTMNLMFWKKMVEAYGPKGLKVRHLSNIMDMVTQRMPYYASVLFKEPGLTFTHSCDSDSIAIIANRVSDDGVTFCHDVSCFSGGEKKRMSVILVLTLADCVPAHKKSNILVLDELDDAMDEDGQYRFVNELLPMLKKDYESVFVISHAAEVKQAAIYDQVWKFTKNSHWTTIDMKAL